MLLGLLLLVSLGTVDGHRYFSESHHIGAPLLENGTRDYQEFTKILNAMRFEIAEVLNISNMHEVKYNKRVEQTARLHANCHSSDNFPFHQKLFLSNNSKDNAIYIFASTHPLQTRYGCVNFTCNHRGDSTDLFCFIGPVLSRDFVFHGPIGSNCTQGKTESGLCKEGVYLMTAIAIRRINRIRKEYAKEYQIANMHELEYSPELEEIGNRIRCDFSSGANYTVIPDPYRNPINSTIENWTNPLQTKFAWIQRIEPCPPNEFEFETFTVMGPFSNFSKSYVIHGPIGSKCPNGVAKSGLCKA